MDLRRTTTLAAFHAGVALLACALLLLLLSRMGAGEGGFEDLARIAGALLLGASAGVLFGLALLAALAWRIRLATWRLAIATLGAILGVVTLYGIVSVNAGTLLTLGIPALLVTGCGLVASVPLWLRRVRA